MFYKFERLLIHIQTSHSFVLIFASSADPLHNHSRSPNSQSQTLQQQKPLAKHRQCVSTIYSPLIATANHSPPPSCSPVRLLALDRNVSTLTSINTAAHTTAAVSSLSTRRESSLANAPLTAARRSSRRSPGSSRTKSSVSRTTLRSTRAVSTRRRRSDGLVTGVIGNSIRDVDEMEYTEDMAAGAHGQIMGRG